MKKRKYTYYWCRDCNIEFFVSQSKKQGVRYCPVCNESWFVEKIRVTWIETDFNYKRPWTKDEEQVLINGRKAGYTWKEIAESLEGRTYNAVKWHMRDMKKRGGVE